jgi:ribosomal-protein-alanine N-acetyltransferase
MIQGDLDLIREIEDTIFATPWTDEMFMDILTRPDAAGIVVEVNGKIAGYICYELLKHGVRVVKLAIKAEYRRQGLGTLLMSAPINLLDVLGPRKAVQCVVSEVNTPMQLLLKKMKFKAQSILHSYYEDGRDGYMFRYRVPEEAV